LFFGVSVAGGVVVFFVVVVVVVDGVVVVDAGVDDLNGALRDRLLNLFSLIFILDGKTPFIFLISRCVSFNALHFDLYNTFNLLNLF
jgi:hypothetical protein